MEVISSLAFLFSLFVSLNNVKINSNQSYSVSWDTPVGGVTLIHLEYECLAWAPNSTTTESQVNIIIFKTYAIETVALLPCQTLLRNTHTIKGLTLDNGLHMRNSEQDAMVNKKGEEHAEPLDEILSQLSEQIWSGSNSAFVHAPRSSFRIGKVSQARRSSSCRGKLCPEDHEQGHKLGRECMLVLMNS